jgi:RNA polymerase sigma factor (sigma-70 family)
MSHDDAASSSSTFEQFLKAMGPKLKRLLAIHRIPAEDAEDVLQQALLALIYHWDTIRDPEGWLTGTLRRHCLMYWRTHRRRLYSAVDTAILEWLSEPVAPPQERSDMICDLRHMIARLPPRCRALLELRFQLGYEPSEVARRLGYRDCSIAKVTNRCLAALAREMFASASLSAEPAAATATTAATAAAIAARPPAATAAPKPSTAAAPANESRADPATAASEPQAPAAHSARRSARARAAT